MIWLMSAREAFSRRQSSAHLPAARFVIAIGGGAQVASAGRTASSLIMLAS
jgi:hypothetical protein